MLAFRSRIVVAIVVDRKRRAWVCVDVRMTHVPSSGSIRSCSILVSAIFRSISCTVDSSKQDNCKVVIRDHCCGQLAA